MKRLFVHHNGTRGDQLFCRAVHRALLASGAFDVAIGVCRDDEELVSDLAGPHCRIVASELHNTAHGSPIDLASLCPADAVSLPLWLGGNSTTATYQWPDIVDALHEDLRRLGIETAVADPDGAVPMLDFAGPAAPTPLRRRSVFLDTQRTRDDQCWFVYDLPRLTRVLPDWDLLCTSPVRAPAANVVDISQLSWAQRSALSEQCEALVGTTRDPFVVTMTEANRWKQKALCGYDARVTPPFWDYPGNPMELLSTMDELVDFLLANVAEGARR